MRAISGYCVAAVSSIIVTACSGSSSSSSGSSSSSSNGSSSSSSSGTTPPNGGVWIDSTFNGSTTPLGGSFALVTETGEFFGVEFPDPPSSTIGTLDFTGDKITGTGEYVTYSPAACPTVLCPLGSQGTVLNGTINRQSTMELGGTLSAPQGQPPPPPLNYSFTYSSSYELGSSLATVAGTWVDNSAGSLVIDSSGNVTGQVSSKGPSGSCTVHGLVTIVNPNYNIYDISLSFSGCTDTPFWQGRDGTGTGIFTVGTGSIQGGTAPVPKIMGGAAINLSAGGQVMYSMFLFKGE
jgi:hypothetical protein